MQHADEVAQHRALVEESAVVALLENLPALLTSDEQSKLRECARLAVAQNCRMAEIGLEAARRHATSDVEEATRREAIGRYYFMLTMQYSEEAATANLIEM